MVTLTPGRGWTQIDLISINVCLRRFENRMNQVFDAADKEVSDEEVGKKGGGGKKGAAAAKDPAEAMGDMLSSFFGGGNK